MKTTLRVVAILILSISTMTFALGSGGPDMVIRKQKEPGMFTLIYKRDSKSDLIITISDSVGTLLFNEMIPMTDGFKRSLNFKTLLPGEYQVEVFDIDGGKESQKVVHQIPEIPTAELIL